MRLWKGPTMSKPHSIRYIRQLMEWGFDKEFIARDAGINVESLMTRLRRAEERERNGNQGTESGASGSQPNS
jgi:IS5 family transposase